MRGRIALPKRFARHSDEAWGTCLNLRRCGVSLRQRRSTAALQNPSIYALDLSLQDRSIECPGWVHAGIAMRGHAKAPEYRRTPKRKRLTQCDLTATSGVRTRPRVAFDGAGFAHQQRQTLPKALPAPALPLNSFAFQWALSYHLIP